MVEHYLTTHEKFPNTVDEKHNRIAEEFGWRPGTDIRDFVQKVDLNFNLIVILEKFDESLVLLKRKFCWKFKDILYLPMRRASYQNKSVTAIHQRARLQHILPAEFALYEHFSRRIDQIGAEMDDFDAEVKEFIKITDRTKEFCSGICRNLGEAVHRNATHNELSLHLNTTIRIEADPWEPDFDVSGLDCVMMMLDPDVYRAAQSETQYPNLRSHPIPGGKLRFERFKGHFAYSFPWEVLYQAKQMKTFLYPCF